MQEIGFEYEQFTGSESSGFVEVTVTIIKSYSVPITVIVFLSPLSASGK